MVSAAFKNVPQTTETTFALSSVFILLFFTLYHYTYLFTVLTITLHVGHSQALITLNKTTHPKFITQQTLHPRLPHPILPIQCQLACMHAIFANF